VCWFLAPPAEQLSCWRRRKGHFAWPLALQEVGILKGLNYDRNIVQFYGACLQPGRDPMLVCEYMEGAYLPQCCR